MNTATAVKILGVFLAVEAIISIAGSQDQRPISHVGRMVRLGAGLALTTAEQ